MYDSPSYGPKLNKKGKERKATECWHASSASDLPRYEQAVTGPCHHSHKMLLP